MDYYTLFYATKRRSQIEKCQIGDPNLKLANRRDFFFICTPSLCGFQNASLCLGLFLKSKGKKT